MADRRRSIVTTVSAVAFVGALYVVPVLLEEPPIDELGPLEAAEVACERFAQARPGAVADRPPDVELLREMVSAAQHAADQDGRFARLARSATALRGAVLASSPAALAEVHQMTVLCQPERLDGPR